MIGPFADSKVGRRTSTVAASFNDHEGEAMSTGTSGRGAEARVPYRGHVAVTVVVPAAD